MPTVDEETHRFSVAYLQNLPGDPNEVSHLANKLTVHRRLKRKRNSRPSNLIILCNIMFSCTQINEFGVRSLDQFCPKVTSDIQFPEFSNRTDCKFLNK